MLRGLGENIYRRLLKTEVDRFSDEVAVDGDRTFNLPLVSIHKWESERMNVLKPALQGTVKAPLKNEINQHCSHLLIATNT